MIFANSQADAGPRLLLLYTDSSDEEDEEAMEEDSRREEMEEVFTTQTQKNLQDNRRNDSLREVVRLKDIRSGINSFKDKKKGKRLDGDRVQQIQLNSKQIVAIYDQEEFASPSTDHNVQEKKPEEIEDNYESDCQFEASVHKTANE